MNVKLSDLGLTPQEADAIMADIARGGSTTQPEKQPEPVKSLPPPEPQKAVIRVNEAKPAIDNTKAKDVSPSLMPIKPQPPAWTTIAPAGSKRQTDAGAGKTDAELPKMPGTGGGGVALLLAGAGAGFLVGGPIGAAIGAGAGFFLGKK